MKTDTLENFNNFMKCKIKSNTFTRSHVNKNKNHNRISEHFRQELCSQKTRNGDSEYKDFKLFLERMILDPLVARPFGARVIPQLSKNIPILPTQKVGQSVIDIKCSNTVQARVTHEASSPGLILYSK